MRRTLFLIPHQIGPLPVFGFGWLLIAVVIALVTRLVIARRSGQSIGQVLGAESLLWTIAGVVVTFIVPMVELTNVQDEPLGVAVRSYGVMMLVGVGAAVGVASLRAKRYSLNPDHIFAIFPYVFFSGIAGARLFYVIQYHENFFYGSLTQSLLRVLKFTEGGLVVYGSFIGGTLGAIVYLLRNRLSVLKFGDVIVPCMFLGVFFGRLGCLMNGCCYGGRCEPGFLAVEFPPTAKVYSDQIGSGELLGFTYDDQRRITTVAAGSLAETAGIKPGYRLESMTTDQSPLRVAARDVPQEDVQQGLVVSVDGRRIRWTPDDLPDKALPVRAAQVISSISSLGLFLVLCIVSTRSWRDGTVMMMGFAGYAVLRYVLELVRVDEAGQFGTSLSISQWVSVMVLVASTAGLLIIHFTSGSARQPSRPAST